MCLLLAKRKRGRESDQYKREAFSWAESEKRNEGPSERIHSSAHGTTVCKREKLERVTLPLLSNKLERICPLKEIL
jgi:hypothetical protein